MNPEMQSNKLSYEELEKIVKAQDRDIKDHAVYIDNLIDNLENFQEVLSQLCCGLFNQKTQKKILNTHLDLIYGDDIHYNYDEDDNRKLFPTTRQGDELKERIDALEERFAQFRENFSAKEVSDTNSVSSTSSEERRVNSMSLCGNE